MKVFVTVGSALQPFDRLLEMVDAAIGTSRESVEGLCQVGPSRVAPRGLRIVRQVGREDFDLYVAKADVVICHGGIGALATAIDCGHLPIALPRRASRGEHINDHQLEIITCLVAMGKTLDAEGGITGEMLARSRDARKEAQAGQSPDFEAIAATLRASRSNSKWRAIPLSLLARWAAPATRLR